MTKRPRTLIMLLTLAQGLAGCDSQRLPAAPSAVAQPAPSPPPNQEGYTLTVSSNTVTPGGQLSVSWTASRGGKDDSIGLFNMGGALCHDGAWWWGYTHSATSGTFAITAPTQPGQYEFRYYRDDECVETARSSPVTVRAGG